MAFFVRPNAWLTARPAFHGVVGHLVVALGAVIVAAGLYEPLKTLHATEDVCTKEPLGDVVKALGATRPILLHVRDGIGTAESGKPLLLEYLAMRIYGNKWCARVRFAQSLGFQFKIFVEATPGLTENKLKKDILPKLRSIEGLVPQDKHEGLTDGRCKTFNFTHPDKEMSDEDKISNKQIYITSDRIPEHGSWRVWILLKDFDCVSEDLKRMPYGVTIWNNFFQPSASVN